MIDWNGILKVIFGAGGFGGGVALLNWFLKKQAADGQTFQQLREAYKEDFQGMRNEILDLKVEVAKLTDQLASKDRQISLMQAQLDLMKTAYPDIPLPLWLKDTNGYMIALNDAYEKAFLIPQGKHRGEYINKQDQAVWEPEVVELFKKNDMIAVERADKVKVIFEDIHDLENSKQFRLLKNWEFLKYPRYIDGTLVGIGGIAIPRENHYYHN